jgi:hypothetical protein
MTITTYHIGTSPEDAHSQSAFNSAKQARQTLKNWREIGPKIWDRASVYRVEYKITKVRS